MMNLIFIGNVCNGIIQIMISSSCQAPGRPGQEQDEVEAVGEGEGALPQGSGGRLIVRLGREPLAAAAFDALDRIDHHPEWAGRHRALEAFGESLRSARREMLPWEKPRYILSGLLIPAWNMACEAHMRHVMKAEVLAAELAGRAWVDRATLSVPVVAIRPEGGGLGACLQIDAEDADGQPADDRLKRTFWIRGPVPEPESEYRGF